ncbi:nucleotidyltransferase family protein [Ureibacillus chungkukjangi]|nr:nucleotidyltransferase family protein [Ureibacillus chungkukjangi]
MCKIGAIILAAGQSVRMGKPKLLLPYLNRPLIHYPVSLAVEMDFTRIIVVGGEHIQQLQSELSEFSNRITIIHNSEYEKGMSFSLKAGITAIENELDSVLIFLGDQPYASKDVVQKLIREFKQSRNSKIVRPRYGMQPGHPILFDKSLFSKFHALCGDEGGKSIIKAKEEKLLYVDFENTKLNLDIDTPQDYELLIKS